MVLVRCSILVAFFVFVRLTLVGVKVLIFILGKNTHLSKLGGFSPKFSWGSWELDACHHLVSGLHDRLSGSAFSEPWLLLLTPAMLL